MPRRSRVGGGTAWHVPAASALIDGAIGWVSAFVSGIKGKNRSQASRLRACGRGRARRQRSGANRGIGVRRGRPKLRGAACNGRAPVGNRRGARRNRTHSGLVSGTTPAAG